MKNYDYDVVWIWIGGTERGRWLDVGAQPGEIAEIIAAENRAGRVAYPGRRSVGPPEGPPSAEELRHVLKLG